MLLECETDKVICDSNVHLRCHPINQNAATNEFLWTIDTYPGVMDIIGRRVVLILYCFIVLYVLLLLDVACKDNQKHDLHYNS